MNIYNSIEEVKNIGQINANSLVNADCLEAMKYIADKSIDLILCDLPYQKTSCSWDKMIPFEPLWGQYNRIIKDNGATVLFASEPFASKLRLSNLEMYKYDWVWDKVVAKGHLVSKFRPMQKTEYILVFGRGRINYYPIMIDRKKEEYHIGKEAKRTELLGGNQQQQSYKLYTKYFPTNLLIFNNHNPRNKLHPTQKPVALLEYLIKTYTNENETVLDNCFGSNSTGVACVNTNRNYIGIEKDEKYFQIGVDRVQKILKENNADCKVIVE